MNRLKGYIIKIIGLIGMALFPMLVSASSDTSIIIPTPTITANNPVCENATLKLETPFQDGVIFHWYDLAGKEISVVATAIIPDMQLSMAGDYRLIAEQNGCFSEPAIITIAVTSRPDTPIVSNNGPLCEGETLLLDGPTLANTTYKWIDPFGTVISKEEDPSIATIPKELAGDYFLEITQFGCASPLGGTEVGVIAINEIPELTIAGPACEGDSLLIRGPHIAGANYNWEGPNGFQSNNIDSLLFSAVDSDLTGVFTLVLEASGCKSPQGQVDVVVFEKPTVTLAGGGNICKGESIDVSFNFTGTAPFELMYNRNEIEQRPLNTSESTVILTKRPVADENFEIINMADKNGCPATITGTAAIKVFSKPEISLITDTLCDGINENYQIKIKITNEIESFDYQGLDGLIEDSIFTSELLANNTAYSFQIIDNNDCQSNQIVGQYNCGCRTSAGTLDPTPITICGSEKARVLQLKEAQLDANDQFLYVLHDSPTGVGNILATSVIPEFEYTENLATNQTYYVSPIAGNQLADSIDFTDGCLSIGQGTPLTFLPIPIQPQISGIQSICPGTVLDLHTEGIVGTAIYSWSTPIEIIETSTPNLIIDRVSADYTGDFRVSIIQDGCASLPSDDYPILVTIPSGQADAGRDTVSCGNPIIYLDAKVPDIGFGVWSDDSGSFIEDMEDPKSRVSSLQKGPNVFYWTLSTEDCPNFERDSVIVAYRPNATALNDVYELDKTETFLEFNVLDNDIAPEGHTIWVEQFSAPHEGVVEQIEEGQFVYRRPFNGFKGNVVFDYLLCFETPTCPILCDTGAVSIDVMLDPLDPGVYVPDGITPNNDGVNDRLIIEGIQNHEENELLIFDRWGNLVFQASPYKNSWDGNYKNSALPEGAYYYVLKTDVTNKRTLKGRVYIIR